MKPIRLFTMIMVVMIVSTVSTPTFANSTSVVSSLSSQTKATPKVMVLPDDVENLPPGLEAELGTWRVSLDNVPAAAGGALLLSRTKAFALARNNGQRATLHKVLKTKKTLLVYDALPGELAEQLGINIPVMKPETERYIVAGITTVNGSSVSGGVLYPLNVKERSAAELATNIQEHLQDVMDILGQYRTMAYLRSPNITSNLVDNCPFGKYNERAIAQRVLDDGSATYDYWTVEFEQQSRGGFSACTNSDYRTYSVNARTEADLTGQLLYKYGPTTTNTFTNATVNIGFTAGYKEASFNLSKSWDFPTNAVNIIDRSDFARNWAHWVFNFDYNSDAAKYTYLGEPGMSLRIRNNYHMGFYRAMNFSWTKPWYPTYTHSARWYYQFAP
jgi:hypothetical protein